MGGKLIKSMLDDIGLGSAIANVIYVLIFLIGFWGARFFINKKMIFGAIFWASLILNFFFYLYLMGNYRLYPKFIYPAVNRYWPMINVVLFIIAIILFVKKKYVNKKKVN